MFIVAIAVMSLIVMWLWNLLIPDLFHGPEVNYLQAAGLLVLTRLLVGVRGRRHWWAPWAAERHWKRHWQRQWHWGPRGSEDHMSRSERRHSQDEWQTVKNKWKAEFGNRMHDWWKEWEAMSPEERRRYKDERQQAKADWKRDYRDRRDSWKEEYRVSFRKDTGREDDPESTEDTSGV